MVLVESQVSWICVPIVGIRSCIKLRNSYWLSYFKNRTYLRISSTQLSINTVLTLEKVWCSTKDSREEGAMTSVALEATVGWRCSVAIWFVRTNSVARSREPAIVDNMTSDFPKPISSANMPPLASSLCGRLAPLMMCW
jgi:hypothetical protein